MRILLMMMLGLSPIAKADSCNEGYLKLSNDRAFKIQGPTYSATFTMDMLNSKLTYTLSGNRKGSVEVDLNNGVFRYDGEGFREKAGERELV